MEEYFNIWKFVAGIGLFLYGMYLMETSLKQLAGRTFKLFLRKHTASNFKAILSGVLATGILQSSSVVSFIILAFVGAGVVNMSNALAVVMGSNLGTTLSSWIVATLGFKFNIESFSFPILGIASLFLVIFETKEKIRQFSLFFIGFGLLFLGLAYTKDGIAGLMTLWNLQQFAVYPAIVFVLLGIFITAIIQSSSATVIIVLSALNEGAIPFHLATAVVIGSELGTTIKVVLGSMGGLTGKKRVALGNLLFNIGISVSAFALMHPLIYFIRELLNVRDPLIALVLFQSTINLGGILIFYPFLNPFARFLENRFKDTNDNVSDYIRKVSPSVVEAAMEALKNETKHIIRQVITLNLGSFKIFPTEKKKVFTDYFKEYEKLKRLEGEILSFYSLLIKHDLKKEESVLCEQWIEAVRNSIYSAKSMKDVFYDRREMSGSANDFKYRQYLVFQKLLKTFYHKLMLIMELKDKKVILTELAYLSQDIQTSYNVFINKIYQELEHKHVNEVELSTIMNLNREIFSAHKAILKAVRNILLDPGEVQAL